MQSHSVRYTLVWALVLTVAWFAVAGVLTDTYQESGWVEIGLTALIFFGIIFFTMRLTNRITLWLGTRMGVEPGDRSRRGAAPPPEPAPPTTERPEHAQRRRQRRRRRGSRARRE